LVFRLPHPGYSNIGLTGIAAWPPGPVKLLVKQKPEHSGSGRKCSGRGLWPAPAHRPVQQRRFASNWDVDGDQPGSKPGQRAGVTMNDDDE